MKQLIYFTSGKIIDIKFENGLITINQDCSDSVKPWELFKYYGKPYLFSSLMENIFGISNIDFKNNTQLFNVNCICTLAVNAKDNSDLIAIGNPETKKFFYFKTKEILTSEEVFYSVKSEKIRNLAEQIQESSQELVELSTLKFSEEYSL